MMRQLKGLFAALAVFVVLHGAALAQTVGFTVDLGPDSPGASKGKGTATLKLDPATKTPTIA